MARLDELEIHEGLLVGFGEILQLNGIDSAFTGFAFGDVGLRSGKQPRNFNLGQASIFTRTSEPMQELTVLPDIVLILQSALVVPLEGFRRSLY